MTIQATVLTALAAAAGQVERAAERLSHLGAGGDVVDLSEEAVQLLAARSTFEVAVKMARVGEQMSKRALDFLG